jgi:ABC-type branched-subunit amino acid transport system ATPase component
MRLPRVGGLTILLAGQSANVALSLAGRAYLLETGLATLEGSAARREDPHAPPVSASIGKFNRRHCPCLSAFC